MHVYRKRSLCRRLRTVLLGSREDALPCLRAWKIGGFGRVYGGFGIVLWIIEVADRQSRVTCNLSNRTGIWTFLHHRCALEVLDVMPCWQEIGSLQTLLSTVFFLLGGTLLTVNILLSKKVPHGIIVVPSQARPYVW